MKIKYLLALVWTFAISETVQATVTTFTREFDVSSAYVTEQNVPDGTVYSALTLPGYSSGTDIGTPELPSDVFQIRIPAEATNIRIAAVSGSEERKIQLAARIMPTQPGLPTSEYYTRPDFVSPDNAAYSSETRLATVVSDGFVAGDIHIATINLIPALYDDSSREVTLFGKMEVTLEYDVTGSSARYVKSNGKVNTLYQSFRSHFSADEETGEQKAKGLTSATALDHYYIIVPEKLKDGVTKLATWKRQKGYEVSIKTIESVYSDSRYTIGGSTNISGRTETIVDSAASLRAYLYDEFKQNGPFYCLLVGDYRTTMPIRRVLRTGTVDNLDLRHEYNRNPGSNLYVPTDNYFGDFTTQWEVVKPNLSEFYFGKERYPFYPDIVIGRLLCHEISEVNSYTDKLIIYESNPGLGDNAYLSKCVYFEEPDMLFENEIVRKDFDPFGDENTRIAQCGCPKTESEEVGDSAIPYVPHEGSDIIRYISESGFVSAHGHGTPTTISACRWYRRIVTDNTLSSDALQVTWKPTDMKNGMNNLTNFHKPGVMYSIACENAPFDEYFFPDKIYSGTMAEIVNGHGFNINWNMAQSYTNCDKVGGVAFIGNSREGLIENSALQEAIFGKNILNYRIPGVALALSKMSQYSWLHLTTHLIGDPEFSMWLGKPLTFNPRIQLNSSSIHFSSGLSSCKIVLDDFSNSIISHEPSGTLDRPKGDFILSIWHPDYLPFLRYYGIEGTLVTKRDIVTSDALLGGENGKEFLIDKNGALNLYCTEKIEGNGGTTRVKYGGSINMTTYKTCDLSEIIVESGGRFNVKANQEIKLENCVFEEGSEIFLGHN